MFVRRPPSRTARLLRLLTAFVTVWCLGCSAFDPIVERLSGVASASGMSCGDEMTPAPAPHGTRSVAASADGAHRAAGYDCGCQSCHAVAVLRVAVDAPPR